MDDSLFTLRISAYSPDAIPMHRLAEYMQQFALLMGSEAHVHFKKLIKGSTAICVKVEQDKVQAVGERLAKANNPGAPADVARPFKALDDLLRNDNARATIRHGSAQIIKFPGRDMAVAQRIGPVKEIGQLEGLVISVVGKDSTKHIRLLGHDGEEYKLYTRNIELAREFGHNLFNLVRVSGTGTWFRDEDAKWDLDNFLVQSCEPLESASLIEAVAALRDIDNDDWKNLADPVQVWHELRGN